MFYSHRGVDAPIKGGKILDRVESTKFSQFFKIQSLAAVLVAIAIPVFTSQLEKSREATDISNIRSAYAEAMAEYLSSGADDAYYSEVSLKQQLDGWQNKENNTLYTRINGEEKPVTIDDSIVGKDKTVYVNVAADGTVTVTATAVGTKVGASSSTTPDP